MEAMRLARNQVKLRLRAQRIKISYIEQSEINRLAKAWFAEHRAELMDRALCNVMEWQMRLLLGKSSVRIPTTLRTLAPRQGRKHQETTA
jgi:hypothetical protein